MAFRLGSFARGFAERAMEYKTEEENEIKELVKASYLDSLSEARENRKAVKAKREKLTNIGNELMLLGLDETQAAGILASGPDGAARQLDLLRQASTQIKDFDISTVVSSSGEAGISLDEAINRTIGELKAYEGPTEVDTGRKPSIFGASKGFQEQQFARYEKQFGENIGQLRAEAADERVRGALPTTKIDYTKLRDPMQDIQDQLAIAQLTKEQAAIGMLGVQLEMDNAKIQKLLAEIDVLRKTDKDKLDPADVRATYKLIDSQLSPLIINKSGANLSWSETTGYQTGKGASDKETKALENAKEINSEVMYLVRGGMNLDDALIYATKNIIPRYYPGTSTIIPPPDGGDGGGDTTKPEPSRDVPSTLKDVPEETIALVNQFLSNDINKPGKMVRGVFVTSLRQYLMGREVPEITANRIANAYKDRYNQ